MSRDQDFMLKRKGPKGVLQFYEINGPYDLKELKQDALSERESTSFQNLKSKIERMDEKYHSHLGHLRK